MPSGFGAQEENHTGHVLRVTETAEHRSFPGPIEDLGRNAVREPSRADIAGGDRIYVDIS